MDLEQFKDEVIRRLETQAEYADGQSQEVNAAQSWIHRWDGIHTGTLDAIEIIEDVYKDIE